MSHDRFQRVSKGFQRDCKGQLGEVGVGGGVGTSRDTGRFQMGFGGVAERFQFRGALVEVGVGGVGSRDRRAFQSVSEKVSEELQKGCKRVSEGFQRGGSKTGRLQFV